MLRERIKAHFGGDCRVVALRRAERFGSRLFIADCMRRGRSLRVLGSIDETGYIMEQSAMDLLRPERLVYSYERMMLVAFALARNPAAALLLGLGGGAMARHLAAYHPDCATTIAEREPVVHDLARRHFHLARDVLIQDAKRVIASASAPFDVILVDLYDADGAVRLGRDFWRDCARALRSGGALAINWAEFVGASRVAAELADIKSVFGRSYFLVERDSRPNIVQLVPTATRLRPSDLEPRLERLATRLRLPREDKEILRRCEMTTHYPVLD